VCRSRASGLSRSQISSPPMRHVQFFSTVPGKFIRDALSSRIMSCAHQIPCHRWCLIQPPIRQVHFFSTVPRDALFSRIMSCAHQKTMSPLVPYPTPSAPSPILLHRLRESHPGRIVQPHNVLRTLNTMSPLVPYRCSHLLGRLPSDEIPGVSPLGCALLAVRACLLVLLYRAHPTSFPHIQPTLLSYLVSDTQVPHCLM
jgi:hypothetical protein